MNTDTNGRIQEVRVAKPDVHVDVDPVFIAHIESLTGFLDLLEVADLDIEKSAIRIHELRKLVVARLEAESERVKLLAVKKAWNDKKRAQQKADAAELEELRRQKRLAEAQAAAETAKS